MAQRFARFTPDEEALEQEADSLLSRLPRDRERPAYTERQLSRHGYRVDLRVLAGKSSSPVQPIRDELRFLASVTSIKPEHRRCFNLWIDGWSQQEIAKVYRISQQFVSQRIHSALRACYDASPISFRRFSEHTVYHAPRHQREVSKSRTCAWCGDEFTARTPWGPYCSLPCYKRVKHREKR